MINLGDDLYDICAVADRRLHGVKLQPETVKINVPLTLALRVIQAYRVTNPAVEFRLNVIPPVGETDVA